MNKDEIAKLCLLPEQEAKEKYEARRLTSRLDANKFASAYYAAHSVELWTSKHSRQPQQPIGFRRTGYIFMSVGFILMLFSFFYDTSVSVDTSANVAGVDMPSAVNNLGKLAQQILFAIFGASLMITGAIFVKPTTEQSEI